MGFNYKSSAEHKLEDTTTLTSEASARKTRQTAVASASSLPKEGFANVIFDNINDIIRAADQLLKAKEAVQILQTEETGEFCTFTNHAATHTSYVSVPLTVFTLHQLAILSFPQTSPILHQFLYQPCLLSLWFLLFRD